MKFRSLSNRWDFGFSLFCLVVTLSPQVVFAQTSRITVEVTVLQVTPDAEARIKGIVPENELVKLGSEEVTRDKFTANAETKHSFITNPVLVSTDKTKSAFVSHQQAQDILGIVKATEGCAVTSTLETTAVENVAAAILDGELKTYCVAYESTKGEFGTTVDVPVHQVIEAGTIVNNIAITTQHGIKLDSTITINRLTELETFTFEGETKSQTIYLPTCLTRQLKFKTEIKSGQVLLVESNYLTKGRSMFVSSQTPTPLARVPYLNRLFKKPSTFQRVPDTKTLFLISARYK